MSIYHEEVEIEDFAFDENEGTFTYPCPCGDDFVITLTELLAGEEDATCPTCSLVVKVIYDSDRIEKILAKAQQRTKKPMKAIA